jgi:Flp pilus assembly protein TadG
MLRPLIERRGHYSPFEVRQRGVTMALVALSLVALISMAALSIDLGSLYEAKAEAQRAADLGALAAARVISLEGVTGDTGGPADTAWGDICSSESSPASLAAINVAQQNLINGAAASKVTVTYGVDGNFSADCTADQGRGFTGFTVNPLVQVYVQQASLPSFFSRIFSLVGGGTSNSGVSATATAEVFNSSGSGSLSGMVPVQPTCVKPWIVPDADPGNNNGQNSFVDPGAGTITNPGVYQTAGTGVIGETFTLNADCQPGGGGGCRLINPLPQGNGGVLQYLPAAISGTPIAVASNASCSSLNSASMYQLAIAGCDQTTKYACGTPNGATADLTENPLTPIGTGGDTPTGVACLINNSQTPADSLAGYSSVPPPPTVSTYPFEIVAGSGNPYIQAGVGSGSIVTTSNSIVTVPIANFTGALTTTQPAVTIVGYLQLFIDTLNNDGSMVVTVLNVSGCGDGSAGSPTANGTSPVPIRLITPQ